MSQQTVHNTAAPVNRRQTLFTIELAPDARLVT